MSLEQFTADRPSEYADDYGVRTMLKRETWLPLVLAVAFTACTERDPSGPGEKSSEAPKGVVVSNVRIPSATPAAARYAAASTGLVTYVSVAPGTFPTGVTATVRNLTTGGPPYVVAILNGGFDPVQIEAAEGNELSIEIVTEGGAAMQPVFVKVPPRRPPRVVRTSPAAGRVDVALNVQVTGVFSEPIDRTTAQASFGLYVNGNRVSGSIHLSDDGISAEFVPDSPLLPHTSYEVRIDKGIRDLDGDALEDAVTATFTTGDAIPVSSREIGAIAFTMRSDAQIWRVNVDGTGLVRLTDLAPRNANYPRYSPDGQRIAFSVFTPGLFGNWDIYLMNADGSGLTQRTFTGSFKSAAWSPDGRKLALSDEDFYFANLFIMDVDDGSAPVQIAKMARTPAWSPDGKSIAYVQTSGDDGYHDIIVMNADGTEGRMVFPTDGGGISGLGWSPDGTTLAFSKCTQGGCGIYLINPDGSNLRRIADTAGNELEWSRDGKWIAFSGGESGVPRIMYIPATGGPAKIVMSGAYFTSWRP